MDARSLSELIKQEALRAGFDRCGLTPARPLIAEREKLKEWLSHGYNGGMNFMGRDIEKRSDPSCFYEKAATVVIVALNYYPEEGSSNPEIPRIARYAAGRDYHLVLAERLAAMLERLGNLVPALEGRIFVDSSPLMEKALAVRAGVGVRGRNSLIIVKGEGSFFFLGGMVINLETVYDSPSDYDPCGNCRRCTDACPTGALAAEGYLNASKCIAYLTIEHKGNIPDDMAEKFNGWVFGCDICQEVCPYNFKHKTHSTPELLMTDGRKKFNDGGWRDITPESFTSIFGDTAIERRGYGAFSKNLALFGRRHN